MKFRKKPIIVDVFQITKEIYDDIYSLEVINPICGECKTFDKWPKWLQDASLFSDKDGYFGPGWRKVKGDYFEKALERIIIVKTLNRDVEVFIDDWIVRGEDAKDLYPVRNEVFDKTYERVEEEIDLDNKDLSFGKRGKSYGFGHRCDRCDKRSRYMDIHMRLRAYKNEYKCVCDDCDKEIMNEEREEK